MSHINKVRIKAVYNLLESLQRKVVFVGGATVSLYATRPSVDVRPTDDVDVLVEILNYHERLELEAQLRSKGFEHDISSKIICRYRVQGIVVDIMPTNDETVGFKNIWYPQGFAHAVDYLLDGELVIKILSPSYFIATKLEAFKSRGGSDGRMSHDFEDIVYILENRKSIWNEFSASSAELKRYLQKEFEHYIVSPGFPEWIESHVERNDSDVARSIIQQLSSFCKGAKN